MPKDCSKPISTAARNAPGKLPMPPTTTTTNASTTTVRSICRLADPPGSDSAPPRPASAAPSANTAENSRFSLTPRAATIWRFSVAARTSTPNRVRRISSHSNASISGPMAIRYRSKREIRASPMRTKARSQGGRGRVRSAAPQINWVRSCTISSTPKVNSS